MASSEGRRAFLLGITLNELGFIMFFLLMLISAVTLQQTKQQLAEETQQNELIQAKLTKLQDIDAEFKRLQLFETRLMQAGGFLSQPSQEKLDALFTRLQEMTNSDNLQHKIASLQGELETLRPYKNLAKKLNEHGLQGDSTQQVVQQLMQQMDKHQQEQQLLKGRVAYMQKKLRGNGLDHPPCWADPNTGAVEYLYIVTLYENKISIKAAWPEHRKADLALIPGAKKLAGKSLNQQQLRQQVQPVFAWSKANKCRNNICFGIY